MVPIERIDEVVAIVEAVAQGWPSFDLAIDAGGGHLGRRGSVAWLAVGRGAGDVIALADDLHRRIPRDLAIGAPAKRTQSAHLTVARRADDGLVDGLRKAAAGPIEATWAADRIVLYRSHLGRDGATYGSLHEATLRPARVSASSPE